MRNEVNMTLRKTYSSNLAFLLKGICSVPSALNTHVSGLAIDSREVKKGDLFLAISGSHSTSTDHIKEAISKGANAVVAEGSVNKGKAFEDESVVELFVDNLKEKVGFIADRFFRSPSFDLSVVGVTGTNGKTSVTNYLASYFSNGGEVSGVIGSLGYGLVRGDDVQLKETGFTTPNVVEVHRCLAELRDAGAKNVFMEVSSHGLSQGRVDGVKFEGAVFTNLTREHLDYHGSMEDYASSKIKLFKRDELKFAVVNEDDDYSNLFVGAIPSGVNVFTYGVKSKSDISVLDFQLRADSLSTITADISTPAGEFNIHSGLIGSFNLSNLLAVMSVAVAKQELKNCEQRIQAIKSVNGRMQLVHIKNKPIVIIDYAHTPDALENALEAVKAHCKGKVTLVFGCGGDRDTGKRRDMAKIAENLADNIIVTDDNPRSEAASLITDHIFEGFVNQKAARLVHDRQSAIELAISTSTKNDLILIAGKGHETWQEINGQKFHFSDIEVVQKILGIHISHENYGEVLV
jgi:UDP-N-acetylmuramoyl-L-alanyl-D-glutamate--2,6-diaminopimelate ligase